MKKQNAKKTPRHLRGVKLLVFESAEDAFSDNCAVGAIDSDFTGAESGTVSYRFIVCLNRLPLIFSAFEKYIGYFAIRKYTVSYFLDFCGQGDKSERRAVAKSLFADSCYIGRNFDCDERRTFTKCRLVDVYNAIRNIY